MIEFLNKDNLSEKNEYEEFVKNHPNGNFMQSLCWTGVKNNWDYEAVIIRDSQKCIIASALVLIRKIPFLKKAFLYSPHGPVCDYKNKEVLSELMDGIEILQKKYNGFEIVIDPCITESDTEEISIF